jgi:hypothetical protein
MSNKVSFTEEQFKDSGSYGLLDDDNVEPVCAKCGAPLEVIRTAIKPVPPATKSPIVLIRYARNEAHLHVHHVIKRSAE